MPAAEVDVSIDLVRSLLDVQRPDLGGLSLRVMGHGWDNVSVLIGDELVGRFPRRQASVGLIENEARWLPVLGPRLPLPIPVPVFVGDPSPAYPWPWSIAPLLPGSPATGVALDLEVCAGQLGRFLRALHLPAPENAPLNPYRGVPLIERDPMVRSRIGELGPLVDPQGLAAIWDHALATAPFTGDPLWIHGDFQPHNLLALDRRISAVADFGDITSGDPASDLSIAWSLLPSPVRSIFWDEYGRSDADLVVRSRAWALNLGLAIVTNSADNPVMFAMGKQTVEAVVEDAQL